MRRASYREAVDWIAQNDSAGDCDACEEPVVAAYPTTVLVADIFGLDAQRVARDVVRRRRQLERAQP